MATLLNILTQDIKMKTLNRIFLCLIVLVLGFEIFMIFKNKLSFGASNWFVLMLLGLVLLLPEQKSRVLLFIISLYGIVTIFYYGNTASVPTAMEFTSGVNNVVFNSNSKSTLKILIGGVPVYFYIIEIILTSILFIRKPKILNNKESVL